MNNTAECKDPEISVEQTRRSAIEALADPARLISTLRGLQRGELAEGVGPQIAGRVQRGGATFRDLAVTAIWLARHTAS